MRIFLHKKTAWWSKRSRYTQLRLYTVIEMSIRVICKNYLLEAGWLICKSIDRQRVIFQLAQVH